jgi:hypothetical protein
MRHDFFLHRQGYWNTMDWDLCAQTLEDLAAQADIIVPGHDNYLLTACG